jgi:nitrogen regulatory protein PII
MGYDLVVTIINRGEGQKVVSASKKAGAEGGTIILGRGTGIHEQVKLFGFTIEPEKEIVLTLISQDKSQEVLETIVRETQLEKPGRGIAFILDVKAVAGISHLLG